MGVIYRAHKPGQGREVALKTLVTGTEASEAELARFQAEITAASTLDHPNLVPVYEVGATDGVPWFTMRLMKGGTLRSRAAEFRQPALAAPLLATLARAVHHAHQRGVLHRDLKSENVLFDGDGVPAIGDFGVARRLAEPGTTSSHAVIGTPAYMAPEQARGDAAALTVATDVYALGAMLFELLTGKLPFERPDTLALLRAIDEAPVPSVRALAPGVDRDLDAVVQRCLAKAPAQRYPSALALAEDLERWSAGLPVEARGAGRRGRLTRWALAHPLGVSLGVFGLGSLVAAALIGLSVSRAQEREARQDALRTNAWTAEALAGAVLYQLQHAARAVEDAARTPDVRRALEERGELAEAVTARLLPVLQPEGAASVILLDTAGTVLGRAPEAANGFVGSTLDQRDYVRRALRHGEAGRHGVTISRSFQSLVDGTLKIALSVPVFAEPGEQFLGLLVATVTAGPSLGELRLGSDAHRVARLVVPMEAPETRHAVFLADADVARAPVLVTFPAHSALATQPEEAPALSLPTTARRGEDAAWIDPVTGEGPLLAGFAPVGGTGYVVVVQSHPDDAVEGGRSLARRLSLGVAAPMLLGLSLATLLGLTLRRRAARRR
jgi:serine/threonine-protein kinase